MKGFSSKRIVESRCATGPERKKNCLKARPCIFQSGNFTGCGSEGVNGWLRYTMVPVKAYYHTLITFGQTACRFVFCYTYQFFFCSLWGYFVTERIVCLTCFPGPWPSNLSFLFFFLFFSPSPWYNRTGWLGVKHQLTYFFFSPSLFWLGESFITPTWGYIPAKRAGFNNFLCWDNKISPNQKRERRKKGQKVRGPENRLDKQCTRLHSVSI